MAQATEAVLIVREFLEGLNFPIAPQCITGDLQSMTGLLASRDASHLVGRMIKKLAALVPDSQELLSQPTKVSQEQSHVADPSMVQIVASKAEVDARIAAFIARKRIEVDESNVREFTDVSRASQPDGMTCARVRPATIQRYPSGGHVKLVRQYPVSVSSAASTAEAKTTVTEDHEIAALSKASPGITNDVIHRRCSVLESHLGLPATSIRAHVYERLKSIELRVLELEAQSPEYWSNHSSKGKSANNQLLPSPSKHVGRRLAERFKLASHPYGQTTSGYWSSKASRTASPFLSRRSSNDSNFNFCRSLHESLNMKPLDCIP